jgi:DNA replication factor GINS
LYDELYEAWKEEKQSVELQKLPKDFYTKIAGYIRKMREEGRMLDKKTTKAKLLTLEFENVKGMVEDLFRLRYDKVQEKSFARETVLREILTKEEERLHGEILPVAEAYQVFLKDILQGRASRNERKKKPKKTLLRFIREIPAIVGSDMKTYGPFEPEDIATLPLENARILIKKGVALEVEVE